MSSKAPTYRYVAPIDAAGFWVWVKIGEENKAWAKCTSTKDLDSLFCEMRLAEHPTCGHVSYVRANKEPVAIRLIAATQQPEPIGTTELW